MDIRELDEESAVDDEVWLNPVFAAELPGLPHC